MNQEVKRSLLDAMTRYIMDETSIADIVRVTDFVESQEQGGYCDTCWDSWTEVVMTYDKISGGTGTYTYYGTLYDLITNLLK